MQHVFSRKHISGGILQLGRSQASILRKLLFIAYSCSSYWEEGQNEIHAIINQMDVTIRFWVTNGRIDSFDAFIGFSQRVWGIYQCY